MSCSGISDTVSDLSKVKRYSCNKNPVCAAVAALEQIVNMNERDYMLWNRKCHCLCAGYTAFVLMQLCGICQSDVVQSLSNDKLAHLGGQEFRFLWVSLMG